jgi:hypothetical protein
MSVGAVREHTTQAKDKIERRATDKRNAQKIALRAIRGKLPYICYNIHAIAVLFGHTELPSDKRANMLSTRDNTF